jgi:ABC-2 type transport system permease protein
VFSLGLSLWLSALYVKYRDISYIWEILMQGLFYLVPILYPLSLISQIWMQKIVLLNPIAQAIQAGRYVLISHETVTFEKVFGGYTLLLVPFTIITVILVTGILYFRKESKYFAENI